MTEFWEQKEEFKKEVEQTSWYEIMQKVTKIINYIWKNFESLQWWELSELQMKLAWYKFFLAECVAEFQRLAEFYSIEIKSNKAAKWEEITETIKAKNWKVSNKEQIENELFIINRPLLEKQTMNETYFYMYKTKLSAVDSVITAIVQRISELKRQITQQ